MMIRKLSLFLSSPPWSCAEGLEGDAVIGSFILEPVGVKPFWVGEIFRVIVKSNLGWVMRLGRNINMEILSPYDGDDNSRVGRNDKV